MMDGRRWTAVAVGVAHTAALTVNIIAGNWVAVIWVLTATMWFASWFMGQRTAKRWEAMYYEAATAPEPSPRRYYGRGAS